MRSPGAKLRLGAFFNPTGHHVASWRHPRADADAGINIAHYINLARTAERGKFDMLFLADSLGVREANIEALSRSAQYIANFEPLTLLSALSLVTSNIGLVATASTSYKPPQGRPVIVQAGGSEDMIEVAAEFAEVVFCAPLTLESSKTFYATMKSRVAQHGRRPDHALIMPGLSVLVAASESEANEQYEYLQSLIHPIVAREILSTVLSGVDFSSYDLDQPFPELPPTQGSQAIFANVTEMARKENLTIRQVALRVAGARGKAVVKGSPEQVVDVMQEWFEQEACDGFNIMPPFLPGSFEDFVDLVIPELQKRGLFRSDYEGRTLRANLGLPRPPSRYDNNS